MASSAPHLTAWGPRALLHPAGVRAGLPAEDQDGVGACPKCTSCPSQSAALGFITPETPSPGKYPKCNPSLQCDHIRLKHASFIWFPYFTAVWTCAGVRWTRSGHRTWSALSSLTLLRPPQRAASRALWGGAAQGTPGTSHAEGGLSSLSPSLWPCVRLSWKYISRWCEGGLRESLGRRPLSPQRRGTPRVGHGQAAVPPVHRGHLDLLSLPL